MLGIATLVLGLAEASGPTFSVTYHAGDDCPTRAQLEAAIVARAPASRPAEDAHVRFDVELAPEPGQKRRLRVALDDGSSQDREIDADDCAEAAQSMAVIAAMILASRPTPTPEVAPVAEPAPEPAPAPKPAPAAPQAAPRRDPSPTRPTWLAVAAGVGLESAAAPSSVYAAFASIELGSVTGAALAPSLRLSARYGRAADVSTPIGDARFELVVARLHACALRLGGASAEVRLCAVVDGGALLARGIDARNERSQTMPWVGAGAGAIGQLGLSRRLRLELTGGARGLFVRDQFVFAPSVLIHQPPVIAWDFSAGLAYSLW